MTVGPIATFIIVLLIGIVAQRIAGPSWLSKQIVGSRRADLTSALVGIAGAFIGFHLAALIALPYSYRAPRSYVETNVLGTLNVLDAVRSCGTARLVHTSTSETYGTARTVPIADSQPDPAAGSSIAMPTATAAPSTTGWMIGRVTVTKARAGEAPRSRALSTTRRSKVCIRA